MPLIRKRRVPAVEDDDDENSPPPTQRTQRRRSDASDYGDATQIDGTTASQQQMVKNLVRLALASEYSRIPLRRPEIVAKVLGTQSRQFNNVFDGAQLALRQTFGMELVELPVKELVTLDQRKAAQKTQGAGKAKSATNKQWILRSLLPEKFRTSEILTPPKVPTEEVESAYVGLYSFIVAVIALSGGTLREATLERYMKRTNTDHSTPVGETSKLLQRLIKENYIRKEKETNSDDNSFEYMLGSRGKMEIGKQGTSALVKAVYGGQFTEDLERRLERSLKMQTTGPGQDEQQDGLYDAAGGTQRRGGGRPRKEKGPRRGRDKEEDEESE